MDQNPPLPTPRHLLTSLINTLTTAPPVPAQAPTINAPYTQQFTNKNTNTNPLKALPPSHRALLTTLHVLFPAGMLLQSLDLLDRGLVTRIILSPHQPQPQPPTSSLDINIETELETAKEEKQKVYPPQANIHLPPSLQEIINPQEDREKEKARRNTIYKISSSQPQKSRFSHSSHSHPPTGQTYTVRLQAWNCTCAAFAYSAFPASTISTPWTDFHSEDLISSELKHGEEEDEEWEFGGRSLDGLGGEGVPVCKHLLACLLGERWEGVVGGLVKMREVGREEMGGLGAE